MRNFILLLGLLVSFLVFPQSESNQPPCITDGLMEKLLRDFPEVKSRIESMEQRIHSNVQNRNDGTTALSIPPAGSITIPVVVYIVHDGTAATNLSDSRVNDQLTALNTYFLNTGIKFCLATKVNGTTAIPTVNASDVQTTPGIIHINNPTLSNHLSSAQSNLVATASPQISKERYLRIWVVKSIDGANSGTGGYSMFPNTSPIFDGVVMRYDVFGNGNPNMLANYNLGKVLAHEVGHYLFLYHTFEGGCSTYFNDCTLDGDRVCDTPAVAAPNFSCAAGINSCVENPAVLDDTTNYMDYANNLCQNHFTTGQIERMLMVLNSARSTLFATENLIYTGTCGSSNLLSATITPSDFTPCASTTVATTFTAPTAVTYSWNFGDTFATGSNPNTASTQSASHIYTSAVNSPYTVSLTVTNANGESRTSTQKIFVTNCTPINNYNSYWYVDSRHGLDFRSGRPVFDPSFPNYNVANVACGNQNDSAGNLLFYTNRYKVWNNQHQQINTTDLNINTNHNSNMLLFVPKPPSAGNPISQYYILSQQMSVSGAADAGFRYNIVNVTGMNATMGVIGQPITLPVAQGFDRSTDGAVLGVGCISAVQKCNSDDYWIITILSKGQQLYLVVFSLTQNGLAYVSERAISSWATGLLNAQIEISPNGNKIFVMTPFNPSFICDFNKAEGIISSNYTPITVPASPLQLFGCSFSPDSNLLYITDHYGKKVHQFNINSIGINTTRKEIITTSTESPFFMQLGPDNKLYVSMSNDTNSAQRLSVIHNPNTIATIENPNGCNFSVNGPKPANPNYRVGPGLPNLIDAQKQTAYYPPNTPNVISKYITACNTYKFFPNVCGTSFAWTFTNTTLGTSFTTTDTNPVYTFSQNGTYIVTLKSNTNVLLGTSTPIIITSATLPVINGSTSACLTRPNESITNNSVMLNNGESATWSITGGAGIITGGVTNQPSVNINWSSLPGTILLTKVNASGCISTVTKTITSVCAPLGMEDFTDNVITVSPNPSNGLFTIQSTNNLEHVTMTVFDIRGRIIRSESDFNLDSLGRTVDLSGCQSGMYLLRLSGSDFSHIHKLIKN